METVAAEPQAFEPFLVQGEAGNLFRVAALEGGAVRSHVERVLEMLPIGCWISPDTLSVYDHVNEPLEVHVSGPTLKIYPPPHRRIAYAFSVPNSNAANMLTVNTLIDLTYPGNGQISCAVRFDPEAAGIERWPGADRRGVLIRFCLFPKETEQNKVSEGN